MFYRLRHPLILSLLLFSALESRALTNNLALTPQMGWNDWNSYGCGISEGAVTNTANLIYSNGMMAAGYRFINIDDGWASSRDSNGVIQAYSISTKFPHGIQWLANLVHSQGLKLGIYTDHGTNTCSGCITGANPPKQPGSFSYEYVDAFTYASWGADYLKNDSCNLPVGDVPQTDYFRMADGLMKSGSAIFDSLCPNAAHYEYWSPDAGNSWRTTGDIHPYWTTMTGKIDQNSRSAYVAGPGRWNDPDMLEIGNGDFTNTIYAQSHLSMWCEMAAPLIAGNVITAMTPQTLQVLTNAEAIAVDQDPAGEQGIFVGGIRDSAEVWSKPIGYDFTTRAVALFNRNTNANATATITCNFTNLAFQPNTTATVRDLWAHQDLGTFTNSFTTNVPPGDTVFLKVVGTPVSPPALGTNYLSDQQPVYSYVYSNNVWLTAGKDKTIAGKTITLSNVTYIKGLGVCAVAGIEYNLGGICSRFQSVIGVDDEVGANGSVIFQVFADGRKIYDSGIMTGSSPTQTIDLDVTGVRRLTLGVTDTGNDSPGSSSTRETLDDSDWANARVIVTNTTSQMPEAPAGLAASPGNAITLTWNNTLAALTYNVKRSTTSGNGYTTITNVPLTTFTDTNVASGTTYYYVVSGVSSFGEGSNSVEASVSPCSMPAVPTNVVESSVTISNIVIKWNTAPSATSYSIYRFTGSTPPALIGSGITTTNFTDTPVAAAATNYYVVTAVNACNQSGYSAFAGAVTPPAAPTNLTATPGGSQVSLSWNTPASAAGFNVKRSTVNNGPYTTIASNILGTGYLDTSAANGTTYYYVVSATDIGGESPNSAQVSVTPSSPLTAYWTNTITASAQNWNVNANWTNSPAFPNSSSELTIIAANIAAPQIINLNQAMTIGSLQIGDANGSASYTIAANGGSLTFNATNTASLTQLASSKGDIIAAPVTLMTNLVVINNSANPLTLAGALSSSSGAMTIGSGVLQVGDGTVNGSLGAVNVTNNAALVFNRSDNITMSGVISGSGAVAQIGTGTLNLSGANSFSSGLMIQNGTLQAGNKLALGTQGGTVVITNGGALDVNSLNVTNVALTVSGWGVNSNGAIINNGASQLRAIQSVTLAGDTAFGGPGNWLTTGNPGRWDIRNAGTALTMSGGKPFNLYKVGSNQMSFVSVTIDTNLANIDIQQGMMGFEAGSTSMGNPASNLIVRAGATLEFYQSSAVSNTYTKRFQLYGDGVTATITNWSGGGGSTIYGSMTLNGACIIGINGTAFTNNCNITGSGSLTKMGNSPLILGGNNSYTGNTLVNNGTMRLLGNGSISGSALVTVASGAILDAIGRSDTALTLGSGQTLVGNGTLNGNVTVGSGATLAPGGSVGALTFNNSLTLNGGSTTFIELNKTLSTNDVAQVAGTLTYGGTLMLTNLSGTLANGDSFKLFSAGIYSGAFTNIVPAIPAVNLAWNTNNLNSGILSVVSAPTPPPKFAAMSAGVNSLIFSGSNGVRNWTYYLLASTNVGLPLTNWTIVSTNSFDASGNFNFTNPAGTSAAWQFYLLQLQ